MDRYWTIVAKSWTLEVHYLLYRPGTHEYIQKFKTLYMYIGNPSAPLGGHKAAKDIGQTACSKSFQSFQSQVHKVFQSFPASLVSTFSCLQVTNLVFGNYLLKQMCEIRSHGAHGPMDSMGSMGSMGADFTHRSRLAWVTVQWCHLPLHRGRSWRWITVWQW